MPYELPTLNYKFNALEPVIDSKTMEIHYTKHHAAYIAKLNSALEKYPAYENKKIEDILKNIGDLPVDIQTAVINNGGGYYNHNLYWEVMTPKGAKNPDNELTKMVNSTFGSIMELREIFIKEAVSRFGSGWAWLVADGNKDLEVISTPNQDCPLMSGWTPILGVDVWEHAYYLNYQNRRQEYVEKWWDIVNWDIVSKKYREV